MRQLVCEWTEAFDGKEASRAANRILRKATIARSSDIYTEAFRPRFVSGSPPAAWRLAQVVENCNAPLEVVRPFYYWITARAESLMYRFATTELPELAKSPIREIRIAEAALWIGGILEEEGRSWSSAVRLKVAQGLLAALRDFGILEGSTRKRIAPQHLALEAFCLIAFCLSKLGFEQKSLVRHPDWKLFLLTQPTVERLFLEAHQNGWLDYQCIGEVYRIEFKSRDFVDYANDLFGR